MIKALQGVLANAGDRLFAVRRAAVSPSTMSSFELIDDRACHGESTESRVEDADRRLPSSPVNGFAEPVPWPRGGATAAVDEDSGGNR